MLRFIFQGSPSVSQIFHIIVYLWIEGPFSGISRHLEGPKRKKEYFLTAPNLQLKVCHYNPGQSLHWLKDTCAKNLMLKKGGTLLGAELHSNIIC